ncbi:MAG: hypothetical protein BMS9Abin01_1925 [Gammaproteobacteria bacterium]|nr:MAG: hypothetical protein BMS9Abin01_1925 [Gammaproteobacteria bacterium]
MSTSPQKKWLRRTAAALIALAAIYLVGANVFLNSEFAFELINRKPEKLWIRWDKGWTIVPGVVTVRGLQVRGQDRRFQWYARIDEIRARVALTALVRKTFSTNSIRGHGLEFYMRQRRTLDAEPWKETDLTPPIPGLANPPTPPPEQLYPPSIPTRPWTIELNDALITGLRQVWIDRLRFEGKGRVEGSMTHVVKGTVEVPAGTVTMSSGDVHIGTELAIKDIALTASVSLERFDPKKERGFEVLRFISGSVRIAGGLDNLDFLKTFFRQAPWLRIDGKGRLDADFRLDKGVLAPGTRITVDTADMTTNVFDYTLDAKGKGRVEGRVEVDDQEPVARLALTLDNFSVSPPGTDKLLIRGRGLQIGGESAELDLRDPFRDLTLVVDMPAVEIADLTVLNNFIPASTGIAVRAGSGRVRTRFRSSPRTRVGQGEFEVVGQGVVTQIGEITIAGDMKLSAGLEYGSLKDDKGLQLFPNKNLPLEVTDVELELSSAEIRERKRTVARNVELALETKFGRSTLDMKKALGLLRFTAGSVRVKGTVPDLSYLNRYVPQQTGLRIGAGAGKLQGRFTTAAGQPHATGSLALKGPSVAARFGDLAVAGELNLDTDLRISLPQAGNQGLIVFEDKSSRLEILKGSATLAGGEIKAHKQAVANEVALEFTSTFGPHALDKKDTNALLRSMNGSARIAGNIPDLSYFSGQIPKNIGLRVRAGAARFEGEFATASGQSSAEGSLALAGKNVRAAFREATLSGDIKLATDVIYGGGGTGVVVSKDGPLAIPKLSFALGNGELLLGDGEVVQNLEVALDSSFDRLVLQAQTGRDGLRAVSGSVRVSGQIPGLQFLRAYFRKAPWLDIDGAGQLDADLRVRKGVLLPGSRLAIDAKALRVDFLDYSVKGAGKVRGRIARTNGRPMSQVTVSLDDFEFARHDFQQPYIFGTGFTITGTSSELALPDPFTDLKLTLDLPDSDLPNFGVYNAYVPPDSCIFIYQGSGRMRSRFDFDAKTESASGEIVLSANRVIMQFSNMTMTGDLKVHTRLQNGDMKARSFDMSGTKVELRNAYVGTAKIGTDTTWWAQLELPKGKGAFTTPAQLDARIEMRLRDSRPVVVFLAEKKGIVRWFKNTLTVKDIKARADFRMNGETIEVEDIEMTGDQLQILGELDISRREFAAVLYAQLKNLKVGIELKDGRKKIKLSKAKPWFEKRRQVYQAHKWFAKTQERKPAAEAAPPPPAKDERVVPARTECWK